MCSSVCNLWGSRENILWATSRWSVALASSHCLSITQLITAKIFMACPLIPQNIFALYYANSMYSLHNDHNYKNAHTTELRTMLLRKIKTTDLWSKPRLKASARIFKTAILNYRCPHAHEYFHYRLIRFKCSSDFKFWHHWKRCFCNTLTFCFISLRAPAKPTTAVIS